MSCGLLRSDEALSTRLRAGAFRNGVSLARVKEIVILGKPESLGRKVLETYLPNSCSCFGEWRRQCTALGRQENARRKSGAFVCEKIVVTAVTEIGDLEQVLQT